MIVWNKKRLNNKKEEIYMKSNKFDINSVKVLEVLLMLISTLLMIIISITIAAAEEMSFMVFDQILQMVQ